MVDVLAGREFVDRLSSPAALEELLERKPPLLVIDLDDLADLAGDLGDNVERLLALPIVVAGVGSPEAGRAPAAVLADVIVGYDVAEFARIEGTIDRNPCAATALAVLLRAGVGRSVGEGLVAESAVYSMLQAGPEFQTWRNGRARRARAAEVGRAVRIERDGDRLHVTLTRPALHNALNTRMRDELYDALLVAASDPVLRVVLDGEGPSFCAGGDLDEFGTRSDPASAHLIRLRRSVGRLLASIADRVEVVVHGACIGSGIELPAFASRVVARPDARFGLPEVGLGLIPGAGGTVSVTRRIGRHRTAYLALSGETIDASTALSWGLVDGIAAADVS